MVVIKKTVQKELKIPYLIDEFCCEEVDCAGIKCTDCILYTSNFKSLREMYIKEHPKEAFDEEDVSN